MSCRDACVMIIERLSTKIIRFQQEVNQNKKESKRVDDWNNDLAVFSRTFYCFLNQESGILISLAILGVRRNLDSYKAVRMFRIVFRCVQNFGIRNVCQSGSARHIVWFGKFLIFIFAIA